MRDKRPIARIKAAITKYVCGFAKLTVMPNVLIFFGRKSRLSFGLK
jgi:hypothetical protein